MRHKKVILYFLILILLWIFLYYENYSIATTKVTLTFSKLPKGFSGYKIVQLSDLHEKYLGNDSASLILKVRKQTPDAIFITGDLFNADSHISSKEKTILAFMNKLLAIAPVYYVTGNHEISTLNFNLLEKKLVSIGVDILRNNYAEVSKNQETIFIVGIDDPDYATKDYLNKNIEALTKYLEKAMPKNSENNFKILLSHRPEQLELYSKYNFDLIFAGHAHGGQVRLPFIGGLYVPNQGLLPKYTSGTYNLGTSTMIVSRGLGNARMSFRLFNRPQLIVTTLSK